MTWADIAYYNYLTFVEEFLGEAHYSGVPMVKALIDKVGNIPNIKKYVESRTKAWFVSFQDLAHHFDDTVQKYENKVIQTTRLFSNICASIVAIYQPVWYLIRKYDEQY